MLLYISVHQGLTSDWFVVNPYCVFLIANNDCFFSAFHVSHGCILEIGNEDSWIDLVILLISEMGVFYFSDVLSDLLLTCMVSLFAFAFSDSWRLSCEINYAREGFEAT